MLKIIGRFAVTHPQTWISSFLLLGMAAAIWLYSTIGWWVGSAIGAPQTCQLLALAFYAYWFTTNVGTLKAACDQQVEQLRSFQSFME